ncbi:hypothetical protein EGT49_12260 [Companilactobacillus suantsaicola]|uniref:Uncharacterized protein n=1 Tax=Companilactobacillus suantsaicola TaxID=2487723 RepID=A0A4Z0JFG7_9LACO|nr:hypothetical protein [Companilactobacillus suantsaicola]TGD20922.1 hypothetical protein EGT49_12260 [Companilactobacillus suantsaicola]
MALSTILTIISIIGAIGGLLAGIFGLLKKIIEFIDSVDAVITHVNDLDEKSINVHEDIYLKLHNHDQHLTKHDEQLKTLFEWKREKLKGGD